MKREPDIRKRAASALLDYLLSVHSPSTFVGISCAPTIVLDGNFDLSQMVDAVLKAVDL